MTTAGKPTIDALLERHADLGKDPFPEKLPVLDHLLLGIVQEGIAPSRGLEAYKSLVNAFCNFNEMRVSHSREIVDLLEGVPDVETKARRILGVLQFVFETTYSFDLESMRKKPLKQAQKQLSKISGATQFAVAAAVGRALGGPLVPIDAPVHSLLVDLRLCEPGDKADAICAALAAETSEETLQALGVILGELAPDSKRKNAVAAALAATKTESVNGKAKPAPKPADKPAEKSKKAVLKPKK
ncbi:MAG TPA: hypothetical protein VNC50_15115 [Planctomycetia bacterium]|nr:hypothetical protein [Planctomycetia bacterium]